MAIRECRYHSRDGGGTAPLARRPEGASETYTRGMALIDDGSGRLTIWTADADDIEGIAAAPASNNSTEGGANILYYKVLPDANFELSCADSGAFATATCNTGDVGQAYDLAISGGILYVDKAASGSARVRVDRLLDDSGTVHGRVVCKFLISGTDYDDA